jgi:catechol-2,3-dioxygenase
MAELVKGVNAPWPESTALAELHLSTADLHRIRQWFNSMQDTNPAYIEDDDYALYNKVLAVLSARGEWK